MRPLPAVALRVPRHRRRARPCGDGHVDHSDLRAYDFVLVLDAVEVPGARPGQVFSFAPDDVAPTPPRHGVAARGAFCRRARVCGTVGCPLPGALPGHPGREYVALRVRGRVDPACRRRAAPACPGGGALPARGARARGGGPARIVGPVSGGQRRPRCPRLLGCGTPRWRIPGCRRGFGDAPTCRVRGIRRTRRHGDGTLSRSGLARRRRTRRRGGRVFRRVGRGGKAVPRRCGPSPPTATTGCDARAMWPIASGCRSRRRRGARPLIAVRAMRCASRRTFLLRRRITTATRSSGRVSRSGENRIRGRVRGRFRL